MISLLLGMMQIPHIAIGPAVDFDTLSKTFPGRVQTRCYQPAPYRTWVSKYASDPNPGTGYFAVSSDRKDAEGFCREGELVYIDHWTGNRGYLKAGMEFYSKFNGHVRMVNVDDLVTRDVKLVDGTGTIHLALVDGAEIENWTVPPGWTLPRAISLQFCRNVDLRIVKIGAPANTDAGAGYGIQSQRSVRVNASGIAADGVRHAFTVFSGGNIFCGSLRAENPKGSQFDTHGYGAVNVYASDVDCGGSDVSIGGRAKWGDSVELWMVKNAKTLWNTGPTSVTVYDSVFDGPAGFMRNSFGEPKSFSATRCTFTAYSTAPAIYKASADLTVVPKLTLTMLVEFVPP